MTDKKITEETESALDLAGWLLEQIEWDESITRGSEAWIKDVPSGAWGPSRVLSECLLKRHIIDEWRAIDALDISETSFDDGELRGYQTAAYTELKIVADIYRAIGRQGFNPAWIRNPAPSPVADLEGD